MELTNILILALLVEAIIQAIKPIWNSEAKKISIPEICSMVLGIAVAILGKVNIFAGVLDIVGWPVYFLYVLSGIGIGRGPSFIHDLWERLKAIKN